MSKGTQTRDMIIARSAQLFNRQGYFGSSLSDIMRETGLEKGGIYNHFGSKEQLALEAFDYAFSLVQQRVQAALKDKKNAVDRLLALIAVYQTLIDDPLVAGGCPVLNTAVEADDAQPALRARAQNAMDSLQAMLQRIITKGIALQEIRPEVNVEELTTLLIASIEGAIMLSSLYQDPKHIHRVSSYLTHYLETEVRNR
jgi:AcrR family transcriptional regulator